MLLTMHASSVIYINGLQSSRNVLLYTKIEIKFLLYLPTGRLFYMFKTLIQMYKRWLLSFSHMYLVWIDKRSLICVHNAISRRKHSYFAVGIHPIWFQCFPSLLQRLSKLCDIVGSSLTQLALNITVNKLQ